MSGWIRAMTFAAALVLPAAFSAGARAALVYPTPAPSVIAELRKHCRPTTWLRVTTDSARFVTRARLLNEYGLLGLSVRDRSLGDSDQLAWARIARIDVQTNHRALAQFMAAVIVGGVELNQRSSASSVPLAIAAVGGGWLAGAIGSRIVHIRPLYVAPNPAP